MKKIFVITSVILVSLSIGPAQTQKEIQEKPRVIVGYLVDQMCGKKMVMDDIKKSDAKAARHTKECALEDMCKASGYGLVSGGKFYKLDANGDKQAEKFFRTSKKENNFKVEVVAALNGDTLIVESIKDFKAKKILKN